MSLLKKPYDDLTGIEENFVSLYGEVSQFQIDRYNKAFNEFKKIYGVKKAYIASSSGRVEVCGNHTDHNGGKVVSCAISLDTLAFFLPRNDNLVNIKSEGYPIIKVDLNAEPNETIGTSAALVRGVAVGFKNINLSVGGFDAYITSNVLGGAGISSSASFEVLIAEIFNFLYNNGSISAYDKAKVSQFAENVYFGKPCGLLDQTAIAFGGLKKLDFCEKGKIIVDEIDCDLSDFAFVLINTGGSHADLTDEYASIPFEMKEVASHFGKDRLIDVNEDKFYEELPNLFNKVSDRAILRVIHFYTENSRVDSLETCLVNKNYDGFLKVIHDSGVSSLTYLQNCYVGGSVEQPIPKALAISSKYLLKGVNRVHGGGFAGTILNIVPNNEIDDFIYNVSKIFGEKNVIKLKVRAVGTIVL